MIAMWWAIYKICDGAVGISMKLVGWLNVLNGWLLGNMKKANAKVSEALATAV